MKYLRIKKALLQRIADGAYGDHLPSENELADTHGVSRMTARRALQELVSEGYASRVPGRGTFLQPRRFSQGFLRVRPFREHAAEAGAAPSTRVLTAEARRAPATVAGKLGTNQTILVSRLRRLDGEPVMLETRYLRADLCASILHEDLAQDSIHELLVDRLRLPLTRVWQRLEAIALDEGMAAWFGLSAGSPAFRLERVTYTNDDPVTWVEYVMRGDRYVFQDDFSPQRESVREVSR
jgi:GntR family transcriptional regulator